MESLVLLVAWSAAQRISQAPGGMKSSPRDVGAFAPCCIPLRFGASRSATYLHYAGLAHFAICAATNRRPPGLLCRPWTRIYAAGSGYGHGLEDTFQGKADHTRFGCSIWWYLAQRAIIIDSL